ncbi:hypothetical protein EDD37DRAFT_222418 [Exophiala viscosa]|uniref:Uncharacterized protein n=1 Tax=Exophiala viscosa TaxID=2486360 RepID=A0AAN6E3Y0_9EURO|nr:hypothetical protein EDD36DRAFT_2777 [Exophiala viscosa]KAI1626613.1 hypothetical protein EDD37DRAFT_222418 [Exophiala viscosa]
MSKESPYTTVLSSLLPPSTPHIPLSLPVSPHKLHIPAQNISSLQLHPVIESALHIINLDLPSAHFLLRHMQAQPAWEAMYLHGILHRIEGDMDNTRAWYGDVKDSEVFQTVWRDDNDDSKSDADTNPDETPALDRARSFLDKVESYKDSLLSKARASKSSPSVDVDTIASTSLSELRRFLSFCESKFGTDPVTDASSVWISMGDKHKDQAAQMITGGEGWREF